MMMGMGYSKLQQLRIRLKKVKNLIKKNQTLVIVMMYNPMVYIKLMFHSLYNVIEEMYLLDGMMSHCFSHVVAGLFGFSVVHVCCQIYPFYIWWMFSVNPNNYLNVVFGMNVVFTIWDILDGQFMFFSCCKSMVKKFWQV